MKFSTFGQQYMLPQIRRPCKLWHPCGRVRSSTDKFTSLQINHLPRKPVLSSAKGMKDTNRRKSLDLEEALAVGHVGRKYETLWTQI